MPACRPCGHSGGPGYCRVCRSARKAIRAGVRYWYARMILNLSYVEATAWMRNESVESVRLWRRCGNRHYARKTYWRLRNQGLSPAQASAALHGVPVAVRQAQQRVRASRRRHRWGGTPHVGSLAWQRKMVVECAIES